MDQTYPRRWWALAALAVGLLAFGLDMTVLNVALPTLATELRASTSQLQWFSTAYTLVLAAGLLPAGLLGDRFGQKRLLLAALALFGVASVGCAYAGSAEALIAARALLGVGAAFLVPLSASLLTVLFPPRERGRAIAVWATAMSLGIPLGPVVGGWLLDNFWWGSVFLINVPCVLVAIVALGAMVPDLHGAQGQRLDVVGVVLSSAGLAALTYGLVEAGRQGWGSAIALAPMLAGVVVLALFGYWLRRVKDPLVDLGLFRSAEFTWGAVLATLATFALMGAMFVLPQYFQAVFGADSLGTGLRLLPIIGGLLVGVRLAERLLARLGATVVVAAGFALITGGLVTGATTAVSDGYGFTAAWLSVTGVGLGFALPPSMDIAVGALRVEHSGVGSGLLQALRQIGATFGVAILGTVLSGGYLAAVDVTGLPGRVADAVRDTPANGAKVAEATGSSRLIDSVRGAFVHGMDKTLWVCAGFAALAVLLALIFLPRRSEDGQPAQSEHDVVAA